MFPSFFQICVQINLGNRQKIPVKVSTSMSTGFALVLGTFEIAIRLASSSFLIAFSPFSLPRKMCQGRCRQAINVLVTTAFNHTIDIDMVQDSGKD